MQHLSVNDIREKYLSFFESKGHLRLESFSLIPRDDPSILLINAGMTPMKKWFTGAEEPPRHRVTTCQKCIRTPDIARVGLTARHGTFFEMLGNFSFGDYFRSEAIPWAWELLTKVYEMPAERLYCTIFTDDDEACDIWRSVGMPDDHIFRFGKENNFWEHGTGPCGPCSEIFFDRGEKYGQESALEGISGDGDRYVEIWNLVFTQFDRLEDGSYVPLEHKNIDTGAGLERFAIVLQEVDNFFEIDNIRALLDKAAELAHLPYGSSEEGDVALRVIADHIRSGSMMIADGVVPSNEGRGYVLRRLLRRAIRYGRKIGMEGPFLDTLSEVVMQYSGKAYPNLVERKRQILDVLAREEESFNRTLEQGLALLQKDIDEAKSAGRSELSGEQVFRLHDTYGFPLDLTREISAEAGLRVDQAGFDAAMQKQKAAGREAQLKKAGSAWDKKALPESVDRKEATLFTGYDTLVDQAKLLHILQLGEEGFEEVEALGDGEEAWLIFDRSPFYAEMGGQVGDSGLIRGDGLHVKVLDTEKNGDSIWLHHAEIVDGALHQGDTYTLEVDRTRRLAIARNHTATHMLHKALRMVLGDHVEQAGSLVTDSYLRFDFRHFEAMRDEQLAAVEKIVNEAILADYPVLTEVMDLAAAKASGAMALFSEKYGDRVRVLSIGDFSRELCGGTHLGHSSQACYFRILSETGVAAGVRRIEAVTGAGAFALARSEADEVENSARILKTGDKHISEKVALLVEERKKLDKALKAEQSRQSAGQAAELVSQATEIKGIRCLLSRVQAESAEGLRELGDQLKNSLGDCFLLLAATVGEKVLWLAMASPKAVEAGFHAGKLIREVAKMTGGGGGGRPDMAQAGGRDASKIDAALAAAKERLAA